MFLKREWIQIDGTNDTELNMFLQKHNGGIMKPARGGQGKGIFFVNKDDSVEWNHYPDYILEEILIQDNALSRLNATSINTIRILTLRGVILAAAIRIGSEGAKVDNLHANGICGHIDIQSGIVDTPCIDGSFNYYLKHPYSNAALVGFQIPKWDMVCNCAISAAQVIPQVEYIGWDIAILDNSISLIEGNHDPGHDVVQMIAQTGLYQQVRKIYKT